MDGSRLLERGSVWRVRKWEGRAWILGVTDGAGGCGVRMVKGRQGAFPGWKSVTAGTEAGGAGLQHQTQMARWGPGGACRGGDAGDKGW